MFPVKSRLANEYLVLSYRFVLLLFFYAVCRVLFYLFNISLFPSVDIATFMVMLKGGLRFDLSALLYINALYYLLYILPFPWKYNAGYQKFLKWLFLITNGAGLALNAIDFVYYPFILKRTTANVYDILRNEQNMGTLWWQFLLDYWYVFVIWVTLMFLLWYAYSLLNVRPLRFRPRWLSFPVSLVVLTLFSGFSIIGIRGGYRHSTRPITLSNAGEYVESPEQVAIVLNTPFSIIRTYGKKAFVPMHFFQSEEELEAVFNPVYQPNSDTLFTPKNVVIIILESFSREHIGALNGHLENGEYKGYAPFLDSLIKQSVVFPNAFANGKKSIDALPSVTAGIPALVLPYVISEYSSNKINSLASLLGQQGYQTSFFHGAPNGSMGFQAFTKLAGFQRYYGRDEFNDDQYFDGIWGIWDEEFFGFFANELNTMTEPFYSTIFSVSSHHPFEVPERYQGVFPKGSLPLHQCIGYTDNALKLFFEQISKMPWFNNTLFVITADHSTMPYHEEYKNNLGAFSIPMIFYTPDGSLISGFNNRLAQQIDIMPSVLSHLKFPFPFVAFGNNLFDEDLPPFVINYIGGNYQFMADGYVLYFDGKKLTGIYDYLKDPSLTQNLINSIDVPQTERLMKAVLQQYNNRMIENRLVYSN